MGNRVGHAGVNVDVLTRIEARLVPEAGYALDTPNLHVTYAARDFRAMREMGESWRMLDGKPEPRAVGIIGP